MTTADGHQYLRPGAQALDVDAFVAEYEQSELCHDVRRIAESGESTHVYWMRLTDSSQVAFEDADVSSDGGKVRGPKALVLASVPVIRIQSLAELNVMKKPSTYINSNLPLWMSLGC